MNQASEFAALFKLPLAERLQLVEDLWDSIAADSGVLDVPDEVRQELDRRQAGFEANPASGVEWEEVKARLRKV